MPKTFEDKAVDILRALIRADNRMTDAGASDGAAWRVVGSVQVLSDEARRLLGMARMHLLEGLSTEADL